MGSSPKDLYRIAVIQIYLSKKRIKKAIRELPESAEEVTMLSKNCCTVPFSLISNNSILSPSYWLSQEVKKKLIKIVNSSSNLEKAMKDIFTTGLFNDYTQIPPNVLSALKTAWEGT